MKLLAVSILLRVCINMQDVRECVFLNGTCEPLGFYEQLSYMLVGRLHDQGLGKQVPNEDLPPELFQEWCPKSQSDRVNVLKVDPALKVHSPAGIGIVVRTTEKFESTRMQFINNTWALRFPRLTFVSDQASVSNNIPHVDRIEAPTAFLQYFTSGTYMSHVYKGHTGLYRFFSRNPGLPWYGLVCDDSFIFDVFLVEFLQKVTSRPVHDAVCAGHLVREPKEGHWINILEMLRHCDQFAGYPEHWTSTCKEKVGMLMLPFVNQTFIHGAGVFCTHAAMKLLQPHLSTVMSSGVFEMYAPHFPKYVQPHDALLGRCMHDLGIRLVDMDGYFAGHHIPGSIRSWTVQASEFREGLPELRLASTLRPALWHNITKYLQFEALDYMSSVVRAVRHHHDCDHTLMGDS